MKKIIKILTVVLLITLFSSTFVACSSSEDDLLGTWEYKLSADDQLYASSKYTFKKSGDEYSGTYYAGSSYNAATYKFTYKVDGSTIICTLENGNEMKLDYSLSGDTLTIDGFKYTKQ